MLKRIHRLSLLPNPEAVSRSESESGSTTEPAPATSADVPVKSDARPNAGLETATDTDLNSKTDIEIGLESGLEPATAADSVLSVDPDKTLIALPYWRLSGFYLFYFAVVGSLVPYWGLYLQSLDFSAQDIGLLFAVIMGTKIVAPNIWGWIADHTGRRMSIVRGTSLLAALACVGGVWGSDCWWLALVLGVFSFVWNASLPQFEAATMTHLGDDTHRYSVIRLWGSVGFIIAVVGLGALFDQVGVGWLPVVLLVLLVLLWLSSLTVPEVKAIPEGASKRPLGPVLLRPEVLGFFVVCFLLQASHGPYYTFYSIYLEAHDYSRVAVGQLWALGVVAEIAIFFVMHRLLPSFGVRKLLLVSLLLTVLRWCLLAGFVDQVAVMIGAQLLHAASFGVFHVAAISFIHQFFVGRHQGRGQALYSSMSFGAGGALGSLYSGYSWATLGPEMTYLLGAGLAMLAFVVTWRYVR